MTVLLSRNMGGKQNKNDQRENKMYNLLLSGFISSFSMKQRVYCYTSLFEKNKRKDQKQEQ